MGTHRTVAGLALAACIVMTNANVHADPAEWEVLNRQAGELQRQGRPEQALMLAERVLELVEESLGTHHPETATSLSRLARIHQEQRRPEEALPLLERALEIREFHFGTESLEAGETLTELGNSAHAGGDRDRAEECYRRALCGRQRHLNSRL